MKHWLIAVLTLAPGVSLAASAPTPVVAKPAASASAMAAPAHKITFENKLVNGKKTWLPADGVVTGTGPVDITLVNTLNEPHGFEVVGSGEPAIVVQPNETKVVHWNLKKSGSYVVKCQLHPAHVGAKLTVQ